MFQYTIHVIYLILVLQYDINTVALRPIDDQTLLLDKGGGSNVEVTHVCPLHTTIDLRGIGYQKKNMGPSIGHSVVIIDALALKCTYATTFMIMRHAITYGTIIEKISTLCIILLKSQCLLGE